VVGRRRIGTGLVALGLTFAPVVTTAARVHAQITDAEGADGGDVTGGDGGPGSSGILPNGSQNNASPGDNACFSEELCALAGGFDPFATDGFADA
jgi:hypothetical protein